MMYFPPIPELELAAVYDPGVPNKERVLFRTKARVNLAQYLVGIHWQNHDGFVTPLQDFFWLGSQIVEPPTLVFLYSGEGTQQIGQFPDGIPYLTIHMGRKTTVFNRLEIVPVLMRFDAINVGMQFDPTTQKLVTAAKMQPSVKPALQLPGPS